MRVRIGRVAAGVTSASGRWRVRVAAGCALAGAATGCTGGSPGPTGAGPSGAGAPPAKLVLSDCARQLKALLYPGRALSYSCGTLAVPVDPTRPGGPTLPMFVLRVRMAGQTNRIGSLVLNPGAGWVGSELRGLPGVGAA